MRWRTIACCSSDREGRAASRGRGFDNPVIAAPAVDGEIDAAPFEVEDFPGGPHLFRDDRDRFGGGEEDVNTGVDLVEGGALAGGVGHGAHDGVAGEVRLVGGDVGGDVDIVDP